MPKERDIPQPQESWRERNQKAIEGLSEFGGSLVEATKLVNGIVQEVAREHGLTDDIPYGTGLRQDGVVGGQFTQFVSQYGIMAEAFVEVYKGMDDDQLRNGEIKAKNDTGFTTNVGSLIYALAREERGPGGATRRDLMQTWDLKDLGTNPTVMERFKRNTKEGLTQALEDTKNAASILAAERRRYEHTDSLIEDFNNPDAFRSIPDKRS